MVQGTNLEGNPCWPDEPTNESNSSLVPVQYNLVPALAGKSPEEILEEAEKRAKILMKHCRYVQIGDSKHIKIESWQMLGRFDNMVAGCHDAVPVVVEEDTGAKAQGYVRDLITGRIVLDVVAYCMRGEKKYSKKRKQWYYPWKDAPWFQVASMAQTRAQSKALASAERWIAELAGFSGTPAEEMDVDHGNVTPKSTTQTKSQSSKSDPRLTLQKDVGGKLMMLANEDKEEALRLLGKFLRKAGRPTDGVSSLKDCSIEDLNSIKPHIDEAIEKGA